MLGVDFLAAYASKKNLGDYLQIGYSVSDNYMLTFNNQSYSSSSNGNYGIGIPFSYGNVTLSGSKSFSYLQCSTFGWFAWDSYNVEKSTNEDVKQARDALAYYGKARKKNFLPWGMGSIKLTTDSSNRSLTIGGAHQFFGTGKQIYTTLETTRSFLNNVEVTADLDTIISRPFVVKLQSRISHDQWNGFLTHQVQDSIDTLIPPPWQ